MKRFFIIAATILVLFGGCAKTIKPTQKEKIVGDWRISTESFEAAETALEVMKFNKDGFWEMGQLKDGEFTVIMKAQKYSVDTTSKKIIIYKKSGKIDESADYEFLSADRLKVMGDGGTTTYCVRLGANTVQAKQNKPKKTIGTKGDIYGSWRISIESYDNAKASTLGIIINKDGKMRALNMTDGQTEVIDTAEFTVDGNKIITINKSGTQDEATFKFAAADKMTISPKEGVKMYCLRVDDFPKLDVNELIGTWRTSYNGFVDAQTSEIAMRFNMDDTADVGVLENGKLSVKDTLPAEIINGENKIITINEQGEKLTTIYKVIADNKIRITEPDGKVIYFVRFIEE